MNAACILAVAGIVQAAAAASGPNVLFVMADDLRPELGAYGCDHIKTPHLDAFAADPATTTFDHAYVSVAWCSPSRTAILTSRRPDTSMTWSVTPEEYWRDRGGNFTTIPQYFKDQLGCAVQRTVPARRAAGKHRCAKREVVLQSVPL